jgi:glycosyltransferase involved in cell wall biosynthesis
MDRWSGNQPAMSVVIPSYQDPASLEMTLGSLTRQTVPADTFEVVVVLDGGGGGPEYADVEQWGTGLNLRVIRLPERRGRGGARNAGVDAATGNLVLFLDADSYAVPDLLERHFKQHSHQPGTRIVVGKRLEIGAQHLTHLLRGEPIPDSAIADTNGDLRFPAHLDAAVIESCFQTPWLFAYTNNISVPRNQITAVGGFDEDLGTRWGWEDLELFYRIYLALDRDAAAFVWEPTALCYHLPSYRDINAWIGDYWANEALVKQRHPSMDWEFAGLLPPVVTSAKLNHYRNVLAGCRHSGAGRVAPVWPKLRSWLDAAGHHRVLLIGSGATTVELPDGSLTIDHEAPASATNYHLMGTFLPPAIDGLDAVVSVDLWRHLDWSDFCAFLSAAGRTTPVTILVWTVADGYRDTELQYLAAACGRQFEVSQHVEPGQWATLSLHRRNER